MSSAMVEELVRHLLDARARLLRVVRNRDHPVEQRLFALLRRQRRSGSTVEIALRARSAGTRAGFAGLTREVFASTRMPAIRARMQCVVHALLGGHLLPVHAQHQAWSRSRSHGDTGEPALGGMIRQLWLVSSREPGEGRGHRIVLEVQLDEPLRSAPKTSLLVSIMSSLK
jgi:hypothetical protein